MESQLYFKQSYCGCLKDQCRSVINEQIGNILKAGQTIQSLTKLHALLRGLKKVSYYIQFTQK